MEDDDAVDWRSMRRSAVQDEVIRRRQAPFPHDGPRLPRGYVQADLSGVRTVGCCTAAINY